MRIKTQHWVCSLGVRVNFAALLHQVHPKRQCGGIKAEENTALTSLKRFQCLVLRLYWEMVDSHCSSSMKFPTLAVSFPLFASTWSETPTSRYRQATVLTVSIMLVRSARFGMYPALSAAAAVLQPLNHTQDSCCCLNALTGEEREKEERQGGRRVTKSSNTDSLFELVSLFQRFIYERNLHLHVKHTTGSWTIWITSGDFFSVVQFKKNKSPILYKTVKKKYLPR